MHCKRINSLRPPRRGFSLIDLLALIAIAVIVIALILMRLTGGRESSRRMECENNLRQIFLATQSYSLRYGHFPIGTQNSSSPIRSETSGYHHNWITGLLPMLDRQDLYDEIDFGFGVYAAENATVAATALPRFRCSASTTTLDNNATSYAGVASSSERPIDELGDGMFLLGRPLSQRDAVDGASFVLLIGENSRAIGPPTQWNSGTRASLRTAGHPINETAPGDVDRLPDPLPNPLFVGGFSSNHIGGAYFLLVDGSFRLLADQMDLALLQQMASRSDADAL